MTVSNKSTKKGTKPAPPASKKPAPVIKKATKTPKPLSKRIEKAVADVFEWFKGQPASWDRLDLAVNLLEVLVSRRYSDFEEAMVAVYEFDNHRHVLVERLLQTGNIDRTKPWAEVAAIVMSL